MVSDQDSHLAHQKDFFFAVVGKAGDCGILLLKRAKLASKAALPKFVTFVCMVLILLGCGFEFCTTNFSLDFREPPQWPNRQFKSFVTFHVNRLRLRSVSDMDDLTLVVDHGGRHADLPAQVRSQRGPVVANSALVKLSLDDTQQVVGEDGDEKVPLDPP